MNVRLFGLLVLLSMTSIAGADAPPPDISKTLTMAKMLSLAPQPRAEFVRQWDALRDAELARIASAGGGAKADLADAKLRLAFRHAQGRVMYPFFHWRETDVAEIEPDPSLPAVLAQLPSINARLWEFREVREYLDARLHELARQHLEHDPDLAQGDARWLRAELRSLDALLPARGLWMQQAGVLLAKHIDDDGAYGVDQPMGWWLARSPPADTVAKITATIEADRAHLRGTRTVKYREVGGAPLFLHILEPATPRAAPRPAMLWLHGGSATEGTWWHSPVTTEALLNSGVVVVAVDLTTGNRFDRDADQLTDASEAFDYVMAHGAELGIDTRRVGVAGFSSGGSVALLLGTRGAAPSAMRAALSSNHPRPAAVIVSGACADPLSGREDGYFKKTAGKLGDPADFSPFAQLRSGLPPVLAVHATGDEFCSFADMSRFADRSRALGNEVTLVTVEGVSHFFGFYYEPGRKQQREAIAEAIRRWHW
ncbi:MAG: alpha/beta hydrolase [Pseudomonadota bacterium]